jgi:hypothetical protein
MLTSCTRAGGGRRTRPVGEKNFRRSARFENVRKIEVEDEEDAVRCGRS